MGVGRNAAARHGTGAPRRAGIRVIPGVRHEGTARGVQTLSAEVTVMDPREPESEEPVPLGQRLLDRPFLLLVASIVVMFVFYTAWGMLEIASLTEAPLP